MGRHNKEEKPHVSLAAFFTRHSGIHKDIAVLEQDLDPKTDSDKKRGIKGCRVLASTGLPAVVVLVLFGVHSIIGTGSHTSFGKGDQAPATIDPSQSDKSSNTGRVFPRSQTTVTLSSGAVAVQSPPRRAEDIVTVYPTPVGASGPAPTVTTTQTVTQPASPMGARNEPRPTVTETVTSYVPGPRVTVTITLPLPFLGN